MSQFWIAFLVLIAVGYVVAFIRKGSVDMTMGSTREVHTAADPATVADRIRRLGGPYSVDAQADGIIILSSPVTFMSWGFFYPVHIHPEGTGSHILVGVKSKVFQIGPIPMRALTKCVEAIEQALAIPTARVA